MKKTKIVLWLLSVVMVLSTLPNLQAGAADATYYSLSDLLGNEYVTRKSKDGPWLEQTAAKWLPGINPTPLCEQGDAFEIKLRTTDRVDITADSSNGRFYMYIGADGSSWIKTQDDVLVRAQDPNLANHWITLLVINNGSGFDVHYKLDTDEGYRPATYQTDSKCALAGSTAVYVGGTAWDVEYVKYYFGTSRAAEAEAITEDCIQIYGQEFDGPEIEGKSETKIAGVNADADVSDGTLNMVVDQETRLLDTTIPVSGYAEIRFKMENGLRIVTNDGERQTTLMDLKTAANASMYPDVATLPNWHVYDSNIGHSPDLYHTYRIYRNADGMTYSAYHQIEGDGGWIQQIEDADTSNRMDKTPPRFIVLAQGGTAKIDYVRIYKRLNVLTDPAVLSAEKNVMWLNEDFSSPDSDLIRLNYMEITDGTLSAHKLAEGTNGSAAVPLSSFDLSGQWYLRMKLCLNEGGSLGSLVAGGKRLYWDFRETYSWFQSGDAARVAYHTREIGAWYEYLFYFNGATDVSVYYRKVGDEKWEAIQKNIPYTALEQTDQLTFNAGSSGAYAVDDLQIYTGTWVNLEEPELSDSELTVRGKISFGHPDSAYDRRASVIAAAYDKEHGYTSFVQKQDYLVPVGTEKDLTAAYPTGGLNQGGSNAAVMVWDSAETAVPLTDGKGHSAVNMAGDAPSMGKVTGVTASAGYNEVTLSGFAGKDQTVAAALFDQSGEIKAAVQAKANKCGMIELLLSIDPSCSSGTYTLRIQYGDNPAADTEVLLHCTDILASDPITDVHTFKAFLDAYGSDEDRGKISELEFAERAYARYAAAAGNTGFSDLYAFRKAVQTAMSDESTEREMLAAANTAVTEKKWSALETMILTTYRSYLEKCAAGIGTELASVQGIKSTKKLFLRMTDKTFASAAELISRFNAAAAAQRKEEQTAGENTNGGGPGGSRPSGPGGGGSVSVSGGQTAAEPPAPIEKVDAFSDLALVEWARESILKLQKLGIVSGDGENLFHPERDITREEFLKLVMKTLKIPAGADAEMGFSDVMPDAWYYEYVSSAYEKGIINGISDREFGIGKNITRADMAVILKRSMDFCGVEAEAVRPAFVFEDFSLIPEYAQEDISALCEAGLMQGVGGNCFMPLAQATRAEAAVAVERLYEYQSSRR